MTSTQEIRNWRIQRSKSCRPFTGWYAIRVMWNVLSSETWAMLSSKSSPKFIQLATCFLSALAWVTLRPWKRRQLLLLHYVTSQKMVLRIGVLRCEEWRSSRRWHFHGSSTFRCLITRPFILSWTVASIRKYAYDNVGTVHIGYDTFLDIGLCRLCCRLRAALL
jgi:hypothetical protein